MVDWPDRRFLDRVGCERPIFQAPMAGAGGVELCAAAIRGGALGSLPCGMLSPEQVRTQVAEVRAGGNGPLNLNFFCHKMPADADDSAWRVLLQPYYAEFGSSRATAARCVSRSTMRCAPSWRKSARKSSVFISDCPRQS
jgi:nitronate monooxygenase